MIRSLASCSLALLWCSAAPLGASTLLSENFDELTPQLTATSVGAFSAIDGTNVDIVGGNVYGSLCVSPASVNCVDMDGSYGNPQGVLQSNTAFALLPGVNYTLSFDLLGSQRGTTTSTTVDFGPYAETFTLASNDDTSGVVSTTFTVPTATTSYLTFTSNTPGDVGAILDNVDITSNVAGVPEPADIGLVSIGMLSLVILSRKLRAGKLPAGN